MPLPWQGSPAQASTISATIWLLVLIRALHTGSAGNNWPSQTPWNASRLVYASKMRLDRGAGACLGCEQVCSFRSRALTGPQLDHCALCEQVDSCLLDTRLAEQDALH